MNPIAYGFSQKPTLIDTVAVATRGAGIYCPALSTISVVIAATATVNIISNSFDDPTKDKILTTLNATGEYVNASAHIIIIDVTATTGNVSARIVKNSEVD
jgi:hypothetical protein